MQRKRKRQSAWTRCLRQQCRWNLSHGFQLHGIIMFPFPIKESHLDIKFNCRLSEQGCTGTASADILAAVHSARVLCLLFFPELFIPSICVALSLCDVTTEMGERMLPLIPPLTASAPCSFQVSPLPFFTHPAISLPSGHIPSLWGRVKPASRQLRDGRQPQLHLKRRPTDLFQERHSNPDSYTDSTTH